MIQIEPGTFTLSALLLMLLGAFIGYAIGIRRVKFQAKHNAAIELKKVFNPTITKIDNGESPTIMVSASFHKQQETAQEYSAHLSGRELDKYNEAVKNYSNWFRIMCNRSAAEVMYPSESPEYISAQTQKPVELINNILKYANT